MKRVRPHEAHYDKMAARHYRSLLGFGSFPTPYAPRRSLALLQVLTTDTKPQQSNWDASLVVKQGK